MALDEELAVKDLLSDPLNARTHPERNLDMIARSLQELGAARSIVIDEQNVILAGNGVASAAPQAGIYKVRAIEAEGDEIIAVRRRGLSPEAKQRLALYDNRASELSAWDPAALRTLEEGGLDLSPFFAAAELEQLPEGGGFGGTAVDGSTAAQEASGATLAERFGVPPFSVLDARQGYWQARKRAWLALGIQSELGRVSAAPGGHPLPGVRGPRRDYKPGVHGLQPGEESASSIFDPVLCELAYRWFCPADGLVLDPFAGGSVRGILAAKLGRNYLGFDLSSDQIEANAEQALAILDAAENQRVDWHCGDSRQQLRGCEAEADLIFSCPPYGDLESYSEDPLDLSAMSFEDFGAAYRDIIAASCARLKQDRFACFVVGDFRDTATGCYRNFVSLTIEAFLSAGLALYNDAVLITAVGSLPIRVAAMFEGSRKLGKAHQNVLVFLKGDAKRATEAIGPVEFALDLEQPQAEEAAAV